MVKQTQEIAVAVIEYFAEKDNLSGKEAFKKALEVITVICVCFNG